MRWFQVGSAALLLVACGGTAARSPKSSPDSAGAAGEPSSAAGTANVRPGEGGVGGVGTAGMGGSDAGAGGVSGAGDASGAGGSEAGAAGAGGQPALDCTGLDCLLGAELLYVPDRAWQRPATPVTISTELSESDYEPQALPPWVAKFSSDAQTLDLTPTAGGAVAHGTRDPEHQDEAWFELVLFAGGRFVVQASGNQLHAELATYGSGMPVISSTRGLLEAP